MINPINNYNIIPNIGKYVNFSEVYSGEKGELDLSYWVLDYNLEKAKEHIVPEVHRMLKTFEHWFGPYPFYEDSYKLVDAPYPGMEHQSSIAYGNKYLNGFWGRDLSGTGWGKNWDYMIVHESGHEWFGNNITTVDIADMWVHEGFTTYSETLFTEDYYGMEAGNEYTKGIRTGITNSFPVIGFYGVNDEGKSSDKYAKGSNMIHTIRHSIDDDEMFRNILRDMNKTFYHQVVTTQQIENFINKNSGFDFSVVFDQYLRNIEIPHFEFYFSANKNTVHYRYTNCIPGFDLPLVLKNSDVKLKIFPTNEWSSKEINSNEAALFSPESIENMYYIYVKENLTAHVN
ncbi:MAG: M1 family aminopeptidase [bacterium]